VCTANAIGLQSFYLFLFYGFASNPWCIPQEQSNTRTQKWLVIAHYRAGVSTQSTLRGAKHFNSAPTITSLFIVIHGTDSGREMKTF